MIRGILTGGFWGLVTVVIGLSVASLLAPQPAGNRPPEAPLVEAPADATAADTATLAPQDLVVPPDAASEEAAPGSPNVAPNLAPIPVPVVVDGVDTRVPAMADTTSAALPQTGDVAAEPLAPPPVADAASLASGADAPVRIAGQSPAPQVPAPEDDLTLSTDPATPAPVAEDPLADDPAAGVAVQTDQPAEPVAEAVVLPPAVSEVQPSEPDPIPAPLPEPAATVETETEPAAVTATAEAPQAVTVGPVAPAADAALPESVADLAALDMPVETPMEAPADAAPEPPPATLEAPVVTPEPAPGPAPEPETQPETQPEPEPESTSDPDLPAVIVRESDGNPLPEPDATIRINRPGAEPEVAPVQAATDADPLDLGEDVPALVRFAAASENPEAKPLLGIILIDAGDLNDGPAVIGALPFAVTVAIDPSMVGAADLAAAYRAAGIEVLALARLPQGAVPTDVEVTLESVFTTLPEVIGLLDAGEGGLQANSAVTDQVMTRLAADGRGVVTVSRGLNMAARAAETAGVPAGTIFRDLDSDGQDAATIRRFLDQAAFNARQNGAVILLARLRPETISAFMLWGAEQRAEQVAVNPVSAVLLADVGTAP